MTMRTQLLLILTSLLFLPACFTSSNSKAIREYRSPINEFDRSIIHGITHISTGQMTTYPDRKILQFADVLIGKDRFLNIELIGNNIRFYETDQQLADGSRVLLLRQNACCLPDKAFRIFLFSKTGEKIALRPLLQENFQHDTGKIKYPTALAIMDFTNIFSFSANTLVWDADETLTLNALPTLGEYDEIMKEIRWHERSRLTLGMRYAFYLFTVPADLITGPFQFAAILISGPGAK